MSERDYIEKAEDYAASPFADGHAFSLTDHESLVKMLQALTFAVLAVAEASRYLAHNAPAAHCEKCCDR